MCKMESYFPEFAESTLFGPTFFQNFVLWYKNGFEDSFAYNFFFREVGWL